MFRPHKNNIYRRLVVLAICAVLVCPVYAFAGSSNNMTPVNIAGSHTVKGNETLKTGRHTFVLTALDGAPLPDGAENDAKKVTISSNEDFEFGDIRYTKPGIYEYRLTRETEQSENLEEDSSEYSIRIAAFSDGSTVSVYQKAGESGKTDRIVYTDTYICTLTFDLNGGTINGDPGPIIYKYKAGGTINLPGAPERDGYTFLYWKGSRYEAGARYAVTEDHEFEAIYEAGSAGKGVKTGDSSGIYMYAGMLAAAVLILLVAILKRRGRKDS